LECPVVGAHTIALTGPGLALYICKGPDLKVPDHKLL